MTRWRKRARPSRESNGPIHPRDKGGIPSDRIAEYVDSEWSFRLRIEHDEPGGTESVELAGSIIDALGDAIDPLLLSITIDVFDPDFKQSMTLGEPNLHEVDIDVVRDPVPTGVFIRDLDDDITEAVHTEQVTGDLVRQLLTKRLTQPPVTNGLLRWSDIYLNAAGCHIGSLPDTDTIAVPLELARPPISYPLEHREGRTYALAPIEQSRLLPLQFNIIANPDLYNIDVELSIWWTYYGSPEMPGHQYIHDLIDTITRLGDHWKIHETRLGSNVDPNYVRTLEIDANRPTNQLYDGTTRDEP